MTSVQSFMPTMEDGRLVKRRNSSSQPPRLLSRNFLHTKLVLMRQKTPFVDVSYLKDKLQRSESNKTIVRMKPQPAELEWWRLARGFQHATTQFVGAKGGRRMDPRCRLGLYPMVSRLERVEFDRSSLTRCIVR